MSYVPGPNGRDDYLSTLPTKAVIESGVWTLAAAQAFDARVRDETLTRETRDDARTYRKKYEWWLDAVYDELGSRGGDPRIVADRLRLKWACDEAAE